MTRQQSQLSLTFGTQPRCNGTCNCIKLSKAAKGSMTMSTVIAQKQSVTYCDTSTGGTIQTTHMFQELWPMSIAILQPQWPTKHIARNFYSAFSLWVTSVCYTALVKLIYFTQLLYLLWAQGK